MDAYRIFFENCGSEYATQLLYTSFLFMPWRRRRSLFLLRYLLSVAAYVLFGWFVKIPPPWAYLVFFVLIIGIRLLSFKGGIIEALADAVSIYCVQHIIYAISYSITYAFFINGVGDFSVGRVVTPITLAVAYIACFFIYTFRNFTKKKPQFNSPYVVIVGVVFISVAVFLTHYGQRAIWYAWWLAPEPLKAQIFMNMISLICAGLTLLLNYMNYNNQSLKIENGVLQVLLEKDKEQYEKARMNAELINIKYHDIKHKVSAGLMTAEDASEIDELERNYYTGNSALDIILREKSVVCKNAGIRLVCTADGSAMNFVKSYQIYSLLGNAIDNAIESLSDVDDPEKKEIVASITKRGNMCLIRISNYIENNIVFHDGLPKTTKSDGESHGFGTKSMKNVVDNYGGEIYFSTSGKVFTLMIMLPIPHSQEDKST